MKPDWHQTPEDEQKVLVLTGAGLEVVLQLVALVAVAGEGPWGADADLLAVVFALGAQVHGCRRHTSNVSKILCYCTKK